MFKFMFASLLVFGGALHAEEKTCAVKGMHCSACTEMVQSKVCDAGKYATCDVKITDEKKQLGQVHLVTKDQASTIDETAVGAAITDAGYTLEKCAKGKEKAGAGKGKASKAG